MLGIIVIAVLAWRYLFVIDIALVVAICKVSIFMAISAQLCSLVLLLYLAMVMVNGDYGWLVSPVLRLKEQHLFFSCDVP